MRTFAAVLASAAAAAVTPAAALYSSSSPVKLMNQSEFNKKVVNSKEPYLVEFFASWCGHCKQLAPEYEKAAKALKGVVGVAAVEDQAVMGQYGVQGFPTIKFFNGASGKPVDYNGARDAKGMATYAMEQATKVVRGRLGMGGGGGSSGGSGGGSGDDVVVLTDSNFDKEVIEDEKHVWFVKFYAPWCGHCKALEGPWKDLAFQLKGKVKVGKMDSTQEQVKSREYQVQGYPTIKLFPAGKKTASSVIDYQEGRDVSSMVNFATKYYSATLEADQLLNQGQVDETCGSKLCLIAFLPHIMESSAKERKQYLKDHNTAARAAGGVPASFFWSQGGDQFEFEEKLNLGFGFPALVAVHMKKSIFVVHRGSFTEGSVRKFITGLSKPKHVQDLPKALPKIVKQVKWDGKDAPKEEEL